MHESQRQTKADSRVLVTVLNAATGISWGFMVAAAWFFDLGSLLVFIPLTWFSTTAWLSIEEQRDQSREWSHPQPRKGTLHQ
jgi:hypothetical protein